MKIHTKRIKSKLKEITYFFTEQKYSCILAFLAFLTFCISATIDEFSRILNSPIQEFFLYMGFGFVMAFMACTITGFLTSKLKKTWQTLIQIGVALVFTLTGFFIFYLDCFCYHSELHYWGILFAIVAFTIYVFFPKENETAYFANILKYFSFSILLSLMLFIALQIVNAVVAALFNTKSPELAMLCISFFCLVFFFPVCFTYFLYNKRFEPSSGKAFKVSILYVLFPVYVLLVLLLYVYLLKALLTWEIPNGQINRCVSIASCLYFLFYFVLQEYKSISVLKVFYKFGSFIILGLVIVQIIAYAIQVNAFGLTATRYASLLYIIFSVVSITLTFVSKGKFSRYILTFLSALILVGSISPFNLYDVAYKNQMARLVSVLEKYKMFDGTKLTEYDSAELENTITDEDRKKLAGSFNYINRKSHLHLPSWITSEQKHDMFENVFKIKSQRANSKEKFFVYNGEQNQKIDCAGYSFIQAFQESTYYWDNENQNIRRIFIFIDEQQYDITDFLLEQSENKVDTFQKQKNLWFYPDENTAICFLYINYTYLIESEQFKEYQLRGYVLKK